MAWTGVKWFEGLDKDMKDRIHGYLLRDAYHEGSEPDLQAINRMLSESDKVTENFGQPDNLKFRVRISRVTKSGIESRENLFLTKDLSSTYIVSNSEEVEEDDIYILRTDESLKGTKMGLREASVVGKFDYEDL